MIHLNNVTKVYPNGSTGVEGINLHIKKGEFVFIVGSSGSGKSTLMKLLLKELDPTEGDIIINRVKTNDLSRKQIPYLRRSIGVVQQDVFLFADSILENIRYGRPDATEEERQDAQLSVLDLTLFENVAYIMVKHAGEDVPDSPDDWLDSIDGVLSIYEILPAILELWQLNQQTTSIPKKK